jgi:putative endonuclease
MRITYPPLAFGKKSEEIAAQFLLSRGYQILERNYRTPRGELDLIASDGDTLVFVEVKARRGMRFGEPHWAVDRRKRQHLIKASLFYLSKKKIRNRCCRFDLVVIQERSDGHPQINLICNVLEADETSF